MKDGTVKELDDLFGKARQGRRRMDPVWYLNLSYFQGNQWVAWNGNALYRPVLRRDRITYVDNRILPAVRTEVAKLTKTRPVFTVSPTTSDEEDMQAAELGEQLMRYLWKHLNLTELTTKGLLWSRICGAGFFKVFWDPSLGDGTDCVAGPDGKLISDPAGKPYRADQVNPVALSQQLGVPISKKRVNQGDIRVEVRSPFQMFPDPLADSFSEAEWLIEQSVKSVESVRQRYGVDVEPDASANPGLVESSIGGSSTSSYRGVRVREYWHRPGVDHPNGCRVVWCKNKELFRDENPFDAWPYVMLSAIPVPGRLWPTCVTEQLRPLNDELNKVKSQIAENRNRVGNPTVIANINAIIGNKDDFVSSLTIPGGVAWTQDMGSPNQPISYLQGPPLPQYVIDEIARIEEAIQQISGQHEVSSASVPPGVTAASAINLLLEADDTQLGPAVTDHETNLGVLGQKTLKLAARYYTDERTIRLAGDNGMWQIVPFRGAMLRDNTHVEVQAGSAFPQSKAAKQAAMQDLLTFFVQSGNPPHGRQLAQFLKDWEVGGADRLIEDYTLDETQAMRENILMQQDVPVPINDYDNDQAHVDAHQDEQKGPQYASWNPNAKQIIDAHVAAHKQRLASQQAAQMQLEAQQQQGGQSQPPGAGPTDPLAQAQQAAQGQMQLQGTDLQQQIQAAQAQHQIAASGAQQGQQMAQAAETSAQSQRQQEEKHQQGMRHAEEKHQAALRQSAQQPRKAA